MNKKTNSNRPSVTFDVKVIRVDEYNGQPVFVVDFEGKEFRVWKMPGQPDTLKILTCELYKMKGADGKTAYVLRQSQKKAQEKNNEQKKPIEKRSIESWAVYMYSHKWHKYGNEGRCSICGSFFEVKKGWRVDMTDILFCDNCKKIIAEFKKPNPKKRNKYTKVILTPMGNKMR